MTASCVRITKEKYDANPSYKTDRADSWVGKDRISAMLSDILQACGDGILLTFWAYPSSRLFFTESKYLGFLPEDGDKESSRRNGVHFKYEAG
jgi:hypothetical protein